ncbi:MAG: hypothetical protein R3Y21_03125 [Mycoplasmatota bacterium]
MEKQDFPIFIAFILGVFLLSFGIKDFIEYKNILKDYGTTVATFVETLDYDTESENNNLIYEYTIDEMNYKVLIEDALAVVPQIEIYYDLSDPSIVVVASDRDHVFLIIMGLMFTLVPAIMIKTIYSKEYRKLKKDGLIKGTERIPFDPGLSAILFIGILFTIIPLLLLYLITGSINPEFIEQYFLTVSTLPTFVILFMLFIIGIYLIFYTIHCFFKNLTEKK